MPYRTAAPPDAPIPRCPRCVRDLAAHTEMWIERHVCPECRGHFIRRDELARVALVIGVPVDELEGRGAPALPELGCPLCGGIMQRFVIGPHPGVELDRCADHGMWFDLPEWERTLEKLAGPGGVSAAPPPPPRLAPTESPPRSGFWASLREFLRVLGEVE